MESVEIPLQFVTAVLLQNICRLVYQKALDITECLGRLVPIHCVVTTSVCRSILYHVCHVETS